MDLTITEIKSKLKKEKIPYEKDMKKRELLTLLYPHPFNVFFDKIYIINLKDKTERWKKVKKDFEEHGVLYERFNALDGRYKTPEENEKKLEKFEKKYGLKINEDLEAPPASLTLGNYLIYKDAEKKGYNQILICEDDVKIGDGIEREFVEGILDLKRKNVKWDIMYLGCAGCCGVRGISKNKTSVNKYRTDLYNIHKVLNFYVSNELDIRQMCRRDNYTWVASHIVGDIAPGGTYAYALSESGISKLIKILEKKGIFHHSDQVLMWAIGAGKLKSIAFDPPIMWHLEAMRRPDTDIPWDSKDIL